MIVDFILLYMQGLFFLVFVSVCVYGIYMILFDNRRL